MVMGSSLQTSFAQKLIQVFAGIRSTEELVIFVAGTDRMLAFCQEMLDQYDRNGNSPLIQEVDALCSAHAVLSGTLYAEVRKVLLALNRYHDPGQNQYGVLGLSPGASPEEIKTAYRRLSKQHHPDKSGNPVDDGRRFMEISGAYHALMIGAGKRKPAGNDTWRNSAAMGKRRSRSTDQKFFLTLIFVLVASLTVFSIFLAARYNRQATLSQLSTYAGPKHDATPTEAMVMPAALATSQSDSHGPAAMMEQPPRNEDLEATRQDEPLVAAANLKEPTVAAEPAPQDGPEKSAAAEGSIEVQKTEKRQDGPGKSIAADAVPTENHSIPRPEPARMPVAQPKPPTSAEVVKTKLLNTEPAAQPARAKAVAVLPSDTAKASEQKRTDKKISAVLQRYEQHYNNRELLSFLGLFAEGATENGQPMAGLNDQYRSLFDNTQSISMKIHDTTWNPVQAGFQIQAKFNASYTYLDGRAKEHQGDIRFLLVGADDELKIKTLEYLFLQ